MSSIIQVLRKLYRSYIPKKFWGTVLLRRIVQWSLVHIPWLQQRGIAVTIGGYGVFRIEPRLYIGKYDYEEWGSAHNAGFGQWMEGVREKKTIFDVGAHIGLYTLPASRVINREGRIYAFEPSEQNRIALAHHLAYNHIQNVEMVPFLVGAHNGDDVSFFEVVDDVEGMNSVVIKKSANRFVATKKKQVSLDVFCQEYDLLPQVIKIDVEGAELDVLRGAQHVLAKARPLIFLSIHPEQLALLGASVAELAHMIRFLQYVTYTVAGVPTDTLRFQEYILRPR